MKHSPDFRNKMKNAKDKDPGEYLQTHCHTTLDLFENISKRLETPNSFKHIPKTHVTLHENFSLLNHSCNPNCEIVCIGGTIAVFCLRDLHPGE